MAENTIIHKTFTYDVADDYLAQTNELGKTGTWTYDGPDRIWILVDKDTLKYHSWKDDMEDGEHYPTPIDMIKIEVDCASNPLLCTLVGADQIRDYNLFDQYEETLPDGNVYSRPLVPPPDHTYELADIEYDPAAGEFKQPFPWKKPHRSWADLRFERNGLLHSSDYREAADMPESVRAAWAEWRQALRDLPQTFGAEAGGTPSIDPWKVIMPPRPDEPTETPKAPDPQPLPAYHRPAE